MSYNQWIAVRIEPTFKLTIRKANLSWGKFYDYPDKDEEIDRSALNGKLVQPGASYVVASCGREGSASGTEGSFDIYNGATRVGTFSWDCPWGSPENSFSFSGVNDAYVTEVEGGSFTHAIGEVTLKSSKRPKPPQS